MENEKIMELIEKYKPLRYSIIKQFPKLDREDLDQELILTMIEGLEDYEESYSDFSYFLKLISRYKALDLLKKEENHLSIETVVAEDGESVRIIDLLESDENVEIDIERKEKYSILYDSIDMLGNFEKEIIYLYYFKNLSLKEIGKITKKSESTISRMKTTGEKNLKKILKEKNYDY